MGKYAPRKQAFVGIPTGNFFRRGHGYGELNPDKEFLVVIPRSNLKKIRPMRYNLALFGWLHTSWSLAPVMHSTSSTQYPRNDGIHRFCKSMISSCSLALLCMSACMRETLGFPFPFSCHPSLVFVTSCCCSPLSDHDCCLVNSHWYSSYRLPSILVFLPLVDLHSLPSLRL